MNKVILMGRLTRDVDQRYSQTANPVAVAKFSLAIPRKFKREGEPDADFVNCIAFGKTAENISIYFTKGRLISVVGRIQCGSYENKSGQKVYTTDVIVEDFYFTGEKKQDADSKKDSNEGFWEEDKTLSDEDLPF